MLFVFLLYSFAVIFIVILVPARWRNPIVVGWVIGLATGDCGFKPSRCTVECDLGQTNHSHTFASVISSIIWSSVSWEVNMHTVRHNGLVFMIDLAASAGALIMAKWFVNDFASL